MLQSTSRRLFAVLTAVLVICAVGGTPVAAVTGDDTGLTGDGVTTGVESPDASGSDDGDDGDDSEDTTDGDDGETDDETSDDTDGDDGETSDDGETTDDGTEDAGDADTEEDDEADSEDDEADSEDDDSDAYGGSGSHSSPLENASESITAGDGVTDEMTENTASLVRADEEDEDVVGPVDGLEAEPDEVGALTGEEVEQPTDAVEVRTLTLSVGDFEVSLLTYEDPAYGAAPGAADRSALEAADSSAHLRAAIASQGGGVQDRQAIVFGSADASGDGDEPLPPSPGGAAVALGTLAAAAAVRSSPFVATEGARAASSTGSSLLSSLIGKLRPFVFPLRYSRYDDSDPLEHEAREQVYAIVNEEPGSYLSEVSEEADLPLSTTRHHIKVLEREDLVSGAKLRGKRRFYPAYAEGIELAAALNDDSTATIIDALSRIGAASVSDLADELERDPSTISHHLQRLEEDDIVTRERDGRAVVTRLSSDARTALRPESTPRPPEAEEALAGGAD